MEYQEQLEKGGLDTTTLGRSWLLAARDAINNPVKISIPFSEKAFFAAERPQAIAYQIPVKKGTVILISCKPVNDAGRLYFVDLWLKKQNSKKDLIEGLSKPADTILYKVKNDDTLLLRIQPELLVSMEFDVYINYRPSLAFPVAASGNPAFISFWGASRDGGARNHQGVDIRAKFRTPVIASSDGYARKVDNRLGGKTVFISSPENGYSLYYAHLDSQLVNDGQFVKTGDTVGLIGNTGNARGTVPHLHFGIYTRGGAINPIAFIRPNKKEPQEIQKPEIPGKWSHLKRNAKSKGLLNDNEILLKSNIPVYVAGASADLVRVCMPGRQWHYVDANTISAGEIRKLTVSENTIVFQEPSLASPGKGSLPPQTTVSLIGEEDNFYFIINKEGMYGWIAANQ